MKNTFFIFMTILFYNYSYAEEACTEMACHDGLYINVPNSYKWQPGKYQFQFEMDNIKIKCNGELPFKDCRDVHIKCNQDGIVISEVGCALPKNNHGFGSMMSSIFPKKLKIVIIRNKMKLVKQSFDINYQTVTPNGKMCEPKCKQASVDLKFP